MYIDFNSMAKTELFLGRKNIGGGAFVPPLQITPMFTIILTASVGCVACLCRQQVSLIMTCHCCYVTHRQYSHAFCSSPTSYSVNSDTFRVFRFDEGTMMHHQVFGSRRFETTQFSHLKMSECPKKNSGTFRNLKI